MSPNLDFMQHPLHHYGYVVDDIPRAIDFWVRTYGAGPFFVVPDQHFDELTHDGEQVDIDHSAAFGSCGPIGIELQTFKFNKPMPVLEEHIAGKLNRINHASYFLEDPEEATERLERLGLPCILAGRRGPDRLYWHDAPFLGHAIEIHTSCKENWEFVDAIMREADNWDGSDPIRYGGPSGVSEHSRAAVMKSVHDA